ncbi:chromosome segregation protein SMC [Candidatus Pacearchaeota archaeon]|nr:chromosome segregation protein SMC [Candidatus Pacearchaeota archaeon]
MSYVKKLVMHGFKSFPRKTELPFTPGINVILGPNGSGKSNITDALCFVLGRLSIKSMRAAKASNLLFMGTKVASPSKEASVEIVFDNTNNIFGTNEEEISIKRIVRKNGQSIYKINNETKTRQEVLSILAQAGIDPNGFNIVLQGEIQNFVRMQSEERRKVIEEVAGISIYESRKEKSIKELEKTEEKLKEVSAILKERNSYLSNLEKEREAALKHKKLEEDVRKFKKSIFFSDLTKKKNESEEINKEIENKGKESEKIKKVIISFETEIETLEEKISEINSKIQKQTGLEQEKLNREISNLRAELAGLYVKKENHEKKLKEIDRKKLSLQSSMEENEVSIKNLQKESPTIEKNQKELLVKKRELEVLEGLIKKRYVNKSELKSIKERLDDKKELLNNSNNESNFLIEQIESLSSELFDKKTDEKKVEELRLNLKEKNELLNQFEKREREIEKIISVNNSKIEEHKKIIEKVGKLDICPLCKSKITEDHIKSIREEANPKIENFEKEIRGAELEIKEILSKRNSLKREVESISFEINKRQSDISKLNLIHEKNIQVKNLTEKINSGKNEIIELIKNKKKLEDNFDENSNVEEKYETLKIEVEEISLRNKENLSSEISFKQREFERTIISLKQLSREKDELLEELEGIEKSLSEKEKNLEIKRKEEEELTKKAKKYIEERDSFQQKIRDTELDLSEKRNSIYNLEQINNNLKIERAKKDAEVENLETEILEFPEAEIIRMSRDALIEKLKKSEETLIRIGTVNMRALEVYDEIKKEYDLIQEKVETITKEKEGVLRIIHEIDIKKKKAFLGTLTELNEIFTRNFAQISTKGQVFLELQNKKEPFEGGVDVIVKTGHGKYFDIKSLSGGEQTMVALSLIFAIQELKPYAFYILDEIDAALDKRNSERLSGLLKKYMQRGQYIVITHNDEIITGATNLFGVSMHEGISKIISLKV